MINPDATPAAAPAAPYIVPKTTTNKEAKAKPTNCAIIQYFSFRIIARSVPDGPTAALKICPTDIQQYLTSIIQ